MKNNWLILLTFLLLFIGSNVLPYIGLESNVFFTLTILMAIPMCWIQRRNILSNKPLFFLLILICVYGLLKLYSDKGEGTKTILVQISGAPLIFSTFPFIFYKNKHTELWHTITKLIFYAFILETGLAIVERLLNQNILGWNIGNEIIFIGDKESADFRSTALYGHPLYNALMVSTIMSFILISPIKDKYKYILWGMGYVAILCFNTRASIVGNALLMIVYLGNSIFSRTLSLKNKMKIIFSVIILSCIAVSLFLNAGFGNRILEMGLFDENSAQVRIDIWSIFNYIKLEDLLWGISHKDMQYLLYMGGLYATENFWIDQILRLGIIFCLFYWGTLFIFINKLYKEYTFFNKSFTFCTFFLIASTNNSLSSNYLALFQFLLLIVTFNPKNNKNISSIFTRNAKSSKA